MYSINSTQHSYINLKQLALYASANYNKLRLISNRLAEMEKKLVIMNLKKNTETATTTTETTETTTTTTTETTNENTNENTNGTTTSP